MRGQVQHGPALGSGQPGGHGDELAAQRRTAGEGMPMAGEGAGGAQQVVGHRGAEGPRAVGVKQAGGLVGQRPVDQVGEHGFCISA